MNGPSLNTQAVLLLTAPLISGTRQRDTPLLTPGEYRRLAVRLHGIGAEPADLIGSGNVVEECADTIDPERLKMLLARGFQLSQAVDRWTARALWVLSRADPDYPQGLKQRLKGHAPVVLYGCGERSILGTEGVAIVGSRDAAEPSLEYTREVAATIAGAKRTVVSGGAKGVDRTAMNAAMEVGGKATGVLADNLERAALHRDHRNLIVAGQLVLVSPYDPRAGFTVGHAMQRNKAIYALAEAAIVVDASVDRGGTWAGAVEQLKKYATPVFVRSTGERSHGLDALQERGALPWPNPDMDGIEVVVNGAGRVNRGASDQPSLFD